MEIAQYFAEFIFVNFGQIYKSKFLEAGGHKIISENVNRRKYISYHQKIMTVMCQYFKKKLI